MLYKESFSSLFGGRRGCVERVFIKSKRFSFKGIELLNGHLVTLNL